jgi:hypothetical protein
MQGPPFSISEEEIQRLYKNEYSIQLLKSEELTEGNSRLSAVKSMKEKVYLLCKK